MLPAVLPHAFIFDPSLHLRTTVVLASSLEPTTAAGLVLPLITYKLASSFLGYHLQWYTDASISLSVAALVYYAATH